jgi:hypothetical protein
VDTVGDFLLLPLVVRHREGRGWRGIGEATLARTREGVGVQGMA